MKKRYYSREVRVGDLIMGGREPVLIQSMTNTSTLDTKSTVEQIQRLAFLGCDIVRVTTPTLKEAENLKVIKKELQNLGITIPLVADVHLSPKVAERAAQYVEKVRINPGNYLLDKPKERYTQKDFGRAKNQITENIQPLLLACKKYNTALRVGVNLGSLSKRILYRYGNTSRGMVASSLEFIDILLASNFYEFTLSLKASNVRVMQEANVLLVQEMIKQDRFFPLHLGVTEAGAGSDARIKSAAGIGSLLSLGIGDTIRVSLTEEPEEEIPVAKMIKSFSNEKGVSISDIEYLNFHPVPLNSEVVNLVNHSKPLVISEQKSDNADLYFKNGNLFTSLSNKKISPERVTISTIESNEKNLDSFILHSSTLFAVDFLKKRAQAIFLKNPHFDSIVLTQLSLDILQGLGLRYSKTEYIACPSCGRTRFNIMEHLKKVQQKTAQFKGLKIAVMGCIVNGPGEMADADYGYVGAAKGKMTLYRRGKVAMQNIPEDEAADALLEMIEKDGTRNKIKETR